MKIARLAALLLFAASVACAQPAKLAVGSAAPEFSLPDAKDGKTVTLSGLRGSSKAVVVLFVATQCPVSNAYNERMAAIGRDYPGKGIPVVAINSNVAELAAEVKEHAAKHGFAFPVLKDEKSKVADLYGATRTPEAFVVDASGKLVYHGRIDENRDEPAKVTSPDLRNALEALLAGKPVPVAETKAFGCTIKRG